MERKLATALFVDLVDSTALVASHDPEIARRRVTGFFDRVKDAHRRRTAGRSRSSPATPCSRSSAYRPRTRTTPSARCAPRSRSSSRATASSPSGSGSRPGRSWSRTATRRSRPARRSTSRRACSRSAEPGEILIGPTACGLAAGVVTEPLGERELKGFRGGLRGQARGLHERPTGRPLNVVASYVGREEELELLANAFARAVRDRRAQLVTIFGDPGIGKSRLAREFFAGLERTTRPRPGGRSRSERGWRTARWRRWCRRRPGSRRTTRPRRRSRSSARPARATPSPTSSASRRACSTPSPAAGAVRRSPGPRRSGP